MPDSKKARARPRAERPAAGSSPIQRSDPARSASCPSASAGDDVGVSSSSASHLALCSAVLVRGGGRFLLGFRRQRQIEGSVVKLDDMPGLDEKTQIRRERGLCLGHGVIHGGSRLWSYGCGCPRARGRQPEFPSRRSQAVWTLFPPPAWHPPWRFHHRGPGRLVATAEQGFDSSTFGFGAASVPGPLCRSQTCGRAHARPAPCGCRADIAPRFPGSPPRSPTPRRPPRTASDGQSDTYTTRLRCLKMCSPAFCNPWRKSWTNWAGITQLACRAPAGWPASSPVRAGCARRTRGRSNVVPVRSNPSK